MKVLVISHIDNLSGANLSMLSIVEELKDKINFTILTNDKESEIRKVLGKNIEVISAEYDWWYVRPRNSLVKLSYRYFRDILSYYTKKRKLSMQLLNKLKSEKFDLIYTNTSMIDIGAIISRKLNIPHIWHIREFGKDDFGFISIGPEKYRNKCFQDAAAIITISNALKQQYMKIVKEEKLYVVYNGFKINSLISDSKKNNFNKEANLLITGQVSEAKGQKQAIEAVNKLNGEGYNIKLYIAGEVNKAYYEDVISKFENSQWLHMLGRVNNMHELRNKIDIELVCSRCEAFGRVTIEAMLHGIPVIGSASGGTTELIDDEVTGLLYKPNNYEDLSEKIKKLIDNKELYDKISVNALNYAKNFTIERTANKVYNIFKEVTENKGVLNE